MGLFFHEVHIDSGMPGVEIAFLNARAVRLQAIEQLDKRFPTFAIGADDLGIDGDGKMPSNLRLVSTPGSSVNTVAGLAAVLPG